jgi:pimeloyl-ACP methyl ester carboxylesterase
VRRLPSRLAPALLLVAAAALSGCTGSGGSSKPAARPVADVTPEHFTSCAQATCEGEVASGRFQIKMPTTWNGTLLLWSHGYRTAIAAPPSFTAPDTSAESAPSDEVARALLDQGYALAGSSYATNGWAVQDGVKAAEDLQARFSSTIGKPRRTYVWGASLGGLISELISEKHPEWVSGAAPECGAVAGTTENLDGALAIGYMVQTLIDPTLKITNYASPDEAVASFEQAQKVVTAAATGATAKIEMIAAIAHLANRTKTYDGHDFPSTVGAHTESIITALAFTTFGQQEFAQRVGGQGLDITGLDFSKPLNEETTKPLVDGLGGDYAGYLAQLAAGTRPTVDPAARAQARAQGETTGKVAHPTVTLHTEEDPLVPVSNERVLGDRIAADHGGTSATLVQLFTKTPQTYAAPAPYGAGHCNFSTAEQLGLVKVIDQFVRTGKRPTPADDSTAFGTGPNGLDATYSPIPFPLLAQR